ncbi:35640_t:CDS:2, partial [Racocetra persica]
KIVVQINGQKKVVISAPKDLNQKEMEELAKNDSVISKLLHAKHDKSSCESDLKLNNGEYDKELAKEHEEWTGEIYQLINGSGKYEEWERRWKEI